MEVVNIRLKLGFDVFCGRGSPFGNPYVIGSDGDRDDVIRKHREWIDRWLIGGEEVIVVCYGRSYSNKVVVESLGQLRGKRCGCFCKPLPCHLDYLREVLEGV